MRQKFLDCQTNLQHYMEYGKSYLEEGGKTFENDPIKVIEGLYEIDNSVTIELAHNMEREMEKMDQILNDDPDILF